jgi:hypothetical protein
MKPGTDSSNQRYVDVPCRADEQIRLTFISRNKAGYQKDSLRVQIRAADGHLRQAPEIPLDINTIVIGAAGLLLAERD